MIVRFGPYELDRKSGELRKHGIRVRLQGKPFQVLEALLEHPGEVLSREELQRLLWSADTAVDFENGLNIAIKRLRTALADSADTPLYVETVARSGYRFIAPVERPAAPAVEVKPPVPPAPRVSRMRPAALVALLAAGAIGTWALRVFESAEKPRFRQVTFRRGQVWNARFAPDGQSILYAAQWDGGPREIYHTSGVSPESRPLGHGEASLAAVSARGDVALSIFDGTMPTSGATLFTVPMNGGAPVMLERSVMSADWAADGKSMALVRLAAGESRLEYPVGKVLFQTAGWLSNIRLSPDGSRIAFILHPRRHDDAGVVRILTAAGADLATSSQWTSASGLAWERGGGAVWVTATADEAPRSLWRVALDGRASPIISAPGTLTLHDVSPSGRALVARSSQRLEMAVRWKGDTADRPVSWLDWSRVADVHSATRRILFDESGEATGGRSLAYVYSGDTGQALQLGEGLAEALTLDGRRALLVSSKDRSRLFLVPVTGGKQEPLPATGLEYQWVRFLPAGDRVLAQASKPGEGLRLYTHRLDGSDAVAVSGPMVTRHAAISPDGKQVAVAGSDGVLTLYPTGGGTGRTVATPEPLGPLRWRRDGKLLVQHLGRYSEVPARVSVLDLATGKLERWREFGPADRVGVNNVTRIVVADDEESCAFNYRRVLSDLFAVDGLKR
ncbi:MAG: LpqB family beta-propeller domain-containing protein [Bryobacteraceae bacterium]